MASTVLILLLVGTAAARYHPEEPKTAAGRSARINTAEYTAEYWTNQAKEAIEERSKRDDDRRMAKNIVLFLGDGMSVPTLTAARTLKGQNAGATGEESELFFEGFPGVGLVKTYCVNMQTPDSACTATAYLTGVKNNYGTTGVTAAVDRRNCEASLVEANRLQSIAEWALTAGKDVGIVTTTRVTHATPSATYAKTANRYWENDAEIIADSVDPEKCYDIARQLVTTNPGKQFKVILGGGRRELLPNTTVDEEYTNGNRIDGRNLIQEWQQDKMDRNLSYSYIWNREQLSRLFDSPSEYLLGLFGSSHMKYNLERDPVTEPSLEEMTEIAIKMLSRNKKGFFLFVEGGRIDHAHHENYVNLALDETLEFEKAVIKGADMLNEEDTLIVVTADHSHVMALNGYTSRGSDILGLSDDKDNNEVPYMTMSYANGPGARAHVNGKRVDVGAENNFGEIWWRSHADAFLDRETHGGDDVAIFVRGPHYRMFVGLYEQTQISRIMAYAACIGPGLHAEACNGAGSMQYSALFLIVVTVFRFLTVR